MVSVEGVAEPSPRALSAEAGSEKQHAAAFFDLDKTIIAGSSALAFARPLYNDGMITARDVLRSAVRRALFTIRPAGAAQTDQLRAHLMAMCAGWDVTRVREVVDRSLAEVIGPIVFPGAVAAIERHHGAGRDVVIVSSSGEDIVDPIAALLGADRVMATRLAVRDGSYTGEISRYVYGVEKAAAIKDLAHQHRYCLADSYAYSDSVTDIPMLETVGHPCAVNPDRALRAIAAQRGWPALKWARAAG